MPTGAQCRLPQKPTMFIWVKYQLTDTEDVSGWIVHFDINPQSHIGTDHTSHPVSAVG